MAKLRFAVRKFDPFERTLAKFWTEYQALFPSDLEMEFVPMDLEELYETLFVKKGLHSGDWDMVHVNTDWIAQAVSTKGLHALNDSIMQSPPEDYENAWNNSLLKFQEFEGQVFGLPFHDGPECLVVRKDLFEDADEQHWFYTVHGKTLEIPKNWEDFLLVADFFTRPAEQLYGAVFAGYPDGHNAVFDFCIQLWSRGGELVNGQNRVQVENSKAVEALDFYRRLFRENRGLHPHSTTYESVQAGQAFARGEVAMMVNWFGFASWAQIDEASAVRGKVDIAPIPSDQGIPSPSLNVYWLYAIAEGSPNKKLAYDFLRFAVSRNNDKTLSLEGGVGCRYSTWYDEEINKVIPFYNKLAELHETARTLPRITHWPEIAHVIDEAVSVAIQTEQDSRTLLAAAQMKIDKWL